MPPPWNGDKMGLCRNVRLTLVTDKMGRDGAAMVHREEET